jgi:hypothetical protein
MRDNDKRWKVNMQVRGVRRAAGQLAIGEQHNYDYCRFGRARQFPHVTRCSASLQGRPAATVFVRQHHVRMPPTGYITAPLPAAPEEMGLVA